LVILTLFLLLTLLLLSASMLHEAAFASLWRSIAALQHLANNASLDGTGSVRPD
jgi:hypothetical protein